MKTISRYIMTLALLITAVGGAWADETLLLTIESKDYTSFRNGSKTFDEKVTITFSDEVYNDGDDWGWYSGGDPSLLTVAGTNGYTITSCKFYTNNGTAKTGYPIEGESPSVYISEEIVYTDASKTVNIGSKGITKIEVFGAAATDPTIKVTTNAASEQDLFTEASFNMPPFDATADYELVRDMSVQMTATMGDGTDGVRYRVKKAQQGQGYEPADMDMTQVLALVAVNDGIEHKDLTLDQDYTVLIYPVDENGQILSGAEDGVTFQNFTFAPGLYALKAFAKDDSDYAGETALSNTFKLYDYINITFPKGYSTHYYNESLVLDEIRNSLKFYAVTAVTSEKVTLTEIEDKAIPGGTPFIVYNETAEPITAVMGMLQADDVTSAEQFKGTAEDKNMGSQSNCYILRNGDSTPTFRLVEGAGTLPAHRCYIDLGAVAATRSLGFDFGDGTTGIDSVESGELKVDSYYDLQGRKHQGTPQRKGVYVKDGRKVIVR